MLAKGAAEPFTCEATVYSHIFAVPTCMVPYVLYFTLSDIITICTYPIFKKPTIRQVWILFLQGDYAFFVDLKDTCLHIPVVRNHHHFSQFVLQTQTVSMEGCALWAGYRP